MSRYIDADILLEAIEGLTWYHFNEVLGKMIEGANTNVNQPYYKSGDIFKAIDSVPSADVVEVVRCKDCKFNKGKNKCLNEHSIIDIPKDGDYCSYGERKDNE